MDFAVTFDPVVPDAEIISVIVEVFEMFGLADDITIKVNHRQILDGIFTVVGVRSARAKMQRLGSARLFASYLEKARVDSVRRHADVTPVTRARASSW